MTTMTYLEWRQQRDKLDRAYKEAAVADTVAFRAKTDHAGLAMLQYTLPSGTRTTISGLDDDRGLQITCADGRGFLTLGMLSVADLEVFLEIRRAIEAWKLGEIAQIPRPSCEFGPWRKP